MSRCVSLFYLFWGWYMASTMGLWQVAAPNSSMASLGVFLGHTWHPMTCWDSRKIMEKSWEIDAIWWKMTEKYKMPETNPWWRWWKIRESINLHEPINDVFKSNCRTSRRCIQWLGLERKQGCDLFPQYSQSHPHVQNMQQESPWFGSKFRENSDKMEIPLGNWCKMLSETSPQHWFIDFLACCRSNRFWLACACARRIGWKMGVILLES